MVTKRTRSLGAKKKDYRKLTLAEQKTFYKSLVTHSFSEAAVALGFDQSYSGGSLRSVGYNIYKLIDPEKIGIDKEISEMVASAIESRKQGGQRKIVEANVDFMPTDLINPSDNKQVVIEGRNKAAMLIHKKLDLLNRNKKALDAVSLTQLTTAFGILFDKGQIIQGQATENIAVMSKISNDMSPEDTLNAILRMREAEIADKVQK